MKSTDILAYKLGSEDVSAIYHGSTLIFQKEDEPTNILAGKFSEPGDYSIKINNKSTSIVLNDDLTFRMEIDNLTSCDSMFQNNNKLVSITSFPDTSNVKYMGTMFYNCTSLASLNLGNNFNTEKVIDMMYMFYNCQSLTSLNLGNNFNTEKVQTVTGMFKDCRSLVSLNLGNKFDLHRLLAKVTSVSSGTDEFIALCLKLKQVTGTISGISLDIDLSRAPLLTNASAMVFINGLADVTETKKITFKSTTYNTLTDEQIAVATSRGWTVVSA